MTALSRGQENALCEQGGIMPQINHFNYIVDSNSWGSERCKKCPG